VAVVEYFLELLFPLSLARPFIDVCVVYIEVFDMLELAERMKLVKGLRPDVLQHSVSLKRLLNRRAVRKYR